ncbi:hypothetical protein BDZ89DRAFT_1039132 [Hymenopellis radicata]|nr:hypothetical protein BDZ89DRAFT_1039132 [Hymenopellis radicata]
MSHSQKLLTVPLELSKFIIFGADTPVSTSDALRWTALGSKINTLLTRNGLVFWKMAPTKYYILFTEENVACPIYGCFGDIEGEYYVPVKDIEAHMGRAHPEYQKLSGRWKQFAKEFKTEDDISSWQSFAKWKYPLWWEVIAIPVPSIPYTKQRAWIRKQSAAAIKRVGDSDGRLTKVAQTTKPQPALLPDYDESVNYIFFFIALVKDEYLRDSYIEEWEKGDEVKDEVDDEEQDILDSSQASGDAATQEGGMDDSPVRQDIPPFGMILRQRRSRPSDDEEDEDLRARRTSRVVRRKVVPDESVDAEEDNPQTESRIVGGESLSASSQAPPTALDWRRSETLTSGEEGDELSL